MGCMYVNVYVCIELYVGIHSCFGLALNKHLLRDETFWCFLQVALFQSETF